MKPARGALRNNIPGYAGGGLIDGFKRAVGLAPAETMREKFAREDAARAAKQAPATQKPVAAAPEGQTAISSYASGTLVGDRKKQMEEAIGKKVGGAIRGKGTGTSDEIPIMASNGEFMIKASSVKKIGIEALEALNAIGDQPDEKEGKAEAKDEYGMKCGGAVRKKMAGGGLVTDEERQAMVNQIPTGGTGVGPTPQPDPTQSASGTELGRNVTNAISALAPLSGGTSLVNGASRLGAALGASETAGKVASGVAQAMPYVVPAVSAGALGIASSQAEPTPQAPATTPPAGAVRPPVAASVDPVTPVPGGDIPTAPAPNAVVGKDVGYGATRIDEPGKSPLFTNVTNAADNASLQGRAPITAQNQGALDGFQARQDATDSRNKLLADGAAVDQRAADSSDLQQLAARAVLEKQGLSPKRQEAISQRTADAERALQSDALARRGQDITAKGQDVQAGALRANQKLAQDKFAQDSKGVAMDLATKQQMQTLQASLLAEQDPAKRQLIEDNLRAVQGKYEKAAPAQRFTVLNRGTDDLGRNLGQIALDADGQEIVQKNAKPAALPPKDKLVKGQTYPTARGPAVWDGVNFTPV